MNRVLYVVCNAPDLEGARAIAIHLVEARLAACVNIGRAVESHYRWDGALESADEVPLTIKTTEARFAEVQAAILALHPYEVPEIIALPVVDGLPAYLAWVEAETRA